MFKGLSVRVGGAEGKWVNAEDVGQVAVYMNNKTFRVYRRYYCMGSHAFVVTSVPDDDVASVDLRKVAADVSEVFNGVPSQPGDPGVTRPLVDAVREYNREMPVDVAAGDLVRVPNVTPGCAVESHLGHFAMVESLLRDDCNGSTRWNVVLRPWLDDVKQWGAAVTVPYASVYLIPVEMPCTVGVAGVSEYPEAGHDGA